MKLVTLRTYREPMGAHVARALLESAGVSAEVWDDQLIGVNWLFSTAIGEAKLGVLSSDRERALEIIDRDEPGALGGVPEALLPPADGDACPACGSERVAASRLWRQTLAFSLGLGFYLGVGVPFAAWRNRWNCEACGLLWGASEQSAFDEIGDETLSAEQAVRGERRSYSGIWVFLVLWAIIAIGLYRKGDLGH